MKRVYLAGFEVFRQDAAAYGLQLKEICRRYGFEGLYPLDNAVPAGLQPQAAAQWIYTANLALIRHSDLLLANLNNFRGYEPDSGTCFEVGFATALGKPCWAYLSTEQTLVQQVPHRRNERGDCIDAEAYLVEDFGLSRNLMLACSTQIVHGDIEDCLARIVAASVAVDQGLQ